MFPNLEKDVIDDVVRMKQGRYETSGPFPWCIGSWSSYRVGLAVDACLALNT